MRLAPLLRGTSEKGMRSSGARPSAREEKYGGWSANPHGFPAQITVRTHAIVDLKSANARNTADGGNKCQSPTTSEVGFEGSGDLPRCFEMLTRHSPSAGSRPVA